MEGHSSFDLHAQQDVAEVLEILLEVLTGPSIITSAAYNMKSLTTTICHTCHQLNKTENILPRLCFSVLEDFPTLLAKVLETESLIGFNAPYCNICLALRENNSKLSLTTAENCLIVQLTVTKNSALFFVSSCIEVVTEIEEKVFFTRNLILPVLLIIVEI